MLVLPLLFAASVVSAQGYAPVQGACPTAPLLRNAGLPSGKNQTLNADEAAYVAKRKSLATLQTYLGGSAAAVYGGSLSSGVELPTIAIAVSGGGDRAALYGAGCLAAFDGRNASSMAKGTGGLLQAASYLSALSGGSWMLTSFLTNDMPEPYAMVLGANGTGGWNLPFDLFTPSTNASQQTGWVDSIFAALSAKSVAGQPVTFGDWWSRALAYHYVAGTTKTNFFDNTTAGNHGASTLLSDVPQIPSYASGALPFPIIVANVYSVNDKSTPLPGQDVPVQSVVYEITPLEFGSYDPVLASFIPTKYFGTPLMSGTPINASCTTNFDNAGYMTGISSNLFNLYNTTKNVVWTNGASPVNVAWERINSTYYSVQAGQQLDISAVPNPFQGVNVGAYEDAQQTQLRLIDGGLDGEVDAIEPVIVPARKVDILVVVDGTSDSAMNRPLGNSLLATAYRASTLPNGTLSLPPLPKSNATFIALGLNTRPTFFGCAGTPAQLKGANSTSPYPLMVYLPNYDGGAGITNTSTGQIAYPDVQSVAFLDKTFQIATSGIPTNGTADPLWGQCLACAVVERTRGRAGVDQTSACTACFSRYCWDGSEKAVAASGNGTTAASGNGTSTPTAANGTAPASATGAAGGNSTTPAASSAGRAVSISSFLAVAGGLALLA